MRGRRLALAVGVVVVLAAGFFAWRQAQAVQVVAPERTAAAAYGDLTPTVSGTGSIRAAAAVTLVAQAAGSLTSLNVAVGQGVQAGQVLARIDDKGVAAEHVAQAQAGLAAARTQLQQLQDPSAFVSSDQVTQARIAVEQAQAGLAAAQAAEAKAQAGIAQARAASSQAQAGVGQARAAYRRAQAGVAQAQAADQSAVAAETISAPVSGYVVDVAATVGQAVAPGDPLVTLAPNLGAFEIDAQVLDANLYDVSVGEQASAYVSGVNQTLAGTVSQIAGQADQQTPEGNYYKVTISLAIPAGSDLSSLGLQAGMSANVNLFGSRVAQTPTTPNVVQVPGGGKTVTATGSVAYANAWTVTAAAAGNVRSLPFSQGQHVSQGQTVATLAGPALQAAVDQAAKALSAARAGAAQAQSAIGQAQAAAQGAQSAIGQAQAGAQQARAAVQQAQAALDAAKAHVQETQSPAVAPQPRIVAQQAAVAQAQAALDTARRAAGDLEVRAPFGGVIASKLVSAGAQVAVGTPIASLVDPKGMQAVIQVPAAQLGLVAAGQTAALTVEAAGGQRYDGTVSQISPQGQNLGGATVYDVIVDVPHPRGLQGGMSVVANVHVPTLRHVLLIPVAAVSGNGVSASVVVAGPTGTRPQRVTTGVSDGRSVEVLQGLTAGERVVVPSGGP